MADIEVHLVTVERELWTGRAQMVVARTVNGDIGVLVAAVTGGLKPRRRIACGCSRFARSVVSCRRCSVTSMGWDRKDAVSPSAVAVSSTRCSASPACT